MTGLEYEHVVARYLQGNGYTNVVVTQASGDYGIDVIAYKDGHKYAIQCKYYTGSVSLDAVQEAVAGKVMYDCDRAMVVTNSTFTKSARQLAQANGVILLDNVQDDMQSHIPSTPESWSVFIKRIVRFMCKCYIGLAVLILAINYASTRSHPELNNVETWSKVILFVASPLLVLLLVRLLWRLLSKGAERLFVSPAPSRQPQDASSLQKPEESDSVLPDGFTSYIEGRKKNIESNYGLKVAIFQHKPNLQNLVEKLNQLKTSDPWVYYNLHEAVLAIIANHNIVKCSDLQRAMRQTYSLTSRMVNTLRDLGLSVKCGQLSLDPDLYNPEDDYLIISEQEFIDIIGIAETQEKTELK